MAKEAPAMLSDWPGLTSKRLGSGGLNPGGAENDSAAGLSEVEVEVEAEVVVSSSCAATLRFRARAPRVAVAAVGAAREERRGRRWSAAAAGAMDLLTDSCLFGPDSL